MHRLAQQGAYIVTAGTYLKERLFHCPERLELLCDALLQLAEKHQWNLQAWAVLANHYHFVAIAPEQPPNLRAFIRHLHSLTARELNRADGAPGRQVWFEYWETHLTFEKSFFARLSYVHRNAVHHGLVKEPGMYRWCSAGWLERRAEPAFCRRIMTTPWDRVIVPDDF